MRWAPWRFMLGEKSRRVPGCVESIASAGGQRISNSKRQTADYRADDDHENSQHAGSQKSADQMSSGRRTSDRRASDRPASRNESCQIRMASGIRLRVPVRVQMRSR